MKKAILYGKRTIELDVPDSATVISPAKAPSIGDVAGALKKALFAPIGCAGLQELIRRKGPATVCVVVSDITRPVPYRKFLLVLLSEIEASGVSRDAITILVATGMHRPSTRTEKVEMFGAETVQDYRIVDHRAEDPSGLVGVPVRSAGGTEVRVNRIYAESDFRILTGLIEPHFMAGFSGGRKSVCPGLVDLATVSRFHGYSFLSDCRSTNGVLEGNPCHRESLDVARSVPPDFIVNVVIDRDREVAGFFCGDLEKAHAVGAKFAGSLTGFPAGIGADIVVTSGGGYPLDATFYQTVKGMVAGLPFLKKDGVLIIAAECSEGIGSRDYRDILLNYSGNWKKFLEDISATDAVRKDQWEVQMQTRLLERTSRENIVLCSEGVPVAEQERILVVPCERYAGDSGSIDEKINRSTEYFLNRRKYPKIVVLPDGPYVYGIPQIPG